MSFRSSSSSLTSLLSRRTSPFPPSLLRSSPLSPLYLQVRTKISSQEVPRMIRKKEGLNLQGSRVAKLFFFVMACIACGATIWMNNPLNPAYPTIPYPNQPAGVKGSSSFEQERLSFERERLEQGRKNGFKP